MMTVIISVAVGLAIAAWIVWVSLSGWRRRRRWRRVQAEPFPAEREKVLEKRVGFYRRLPEGQKESLKRWIQAFLDEKRFEACGGLPEVTDEMRVTVAAQACLLLLGLKNHRMYPELRSILMYPGAFRDRGLRRFSLPEEDEENDVLLGESWTSGSLVLAWDSVRRGALNADDGVNVTLHEFAHQLDQENGVVDGAPILKDTASYRRWAEVLSDEYEELVADIEDGRHTLIDDYGATEPAEFFAVATETFFEDPQRMRWEHPELYAEFRDFYGQDPAEWPLR